MKRLKIALLAFILIPCLLLTTACTRGISFNKYSDKVRESAIYYYNNYDGNSIIIESKIDSTSTWKEFAYFGENNEQGNQVDFKASTNSTQKIELTVEQSDTETIKNLRVTETTKTTTTGKKENEEETGLVDFESVEESGREVIIIPNGNGYRAYVTNTVEKNGVKTVDQKEYYDFTTDDYEIYLNALFEYVDKDILSEAFFTLSILVVNIYDGELEYYSKGKGDFGVKGELGYYEIKDKKINNTFLTFDNQFENNLPSKFISTMKTTIKNDHIETEEQVNMNVNSRQETTINYSSALIDAPSEFEDATLGEKPIIVVVGAGLSIGL